MDITVKEAHLPIDSDNCIRRECPYCKKEFKITKSDFESLNNEMECFCPYCGQSANANDWHTPAQIDYMVKIATNVAIEAINNDFIKPLKKLNSQSIHVETKELPRGNELINPETDDMVFFTLPCCEKSIKILEDWEGIIHCYFCGFPHEKGAGNDD